MIKVRGGERKCIHTTWYNSAGRVSRPLSASDRSVRETLCEYQLGLVWGAVIMTNVIKSKLRRVCLVCDYADKHEEIGPPAFNTPSSSIVYTHVKDQAA